jgi:hypothetical protein
MKVITEVTRRGTFVALEINGVLSLGVAPRADDEVLKSWSRDNGILGMNGAPVRIDEYPRIRRKIRDKSNQLPSDLPNLLVIHADHLLVEEASLKEAIGEIGPYLAKHPHILGVLIYSRTAFATSEPPAPVAQGLNWIIGRNEPLPKLGICRKPGIELVKGRGAKQAAPRNNTPGLHETTPDGRSACMMGYAPLDEG